MKKYIYSLMVMLLALLTVGFTACGNDDEPKGDDIVGTWQYNHPDDEGYDDYDMYYQFTKDGKYHQVYKDHEMYYGRPSLIIYSGTYTVSGTQLKITCKRAPLLNETVDPTEYHFELDYSVKGDKLMFLGGDNSTFTRVKDSVIEPYL